MTDQVAGGESSEGRGLWRRGVPQPWQVLAPAMPVVGYLVAGILAVGLRTLDYAPGPLAALVGVLAFAVVHWAYPRWRRWGWTITVFALAWTQLHADAPWRTYVSHLPRSECFAYAEVEIVDGDASAYRLPGVQPARNVEARILRLRLTRDAEWIPCSGRVMLRFDDPAPTVLYGQQLRVALSFRDPWGAAVPGAFDYRRYLQSQGIQHMAQVLEMETITATPSLVTRARGGLYHARDAIIASLVRDVPDAEAQGVLAAMAMGDRRGIDMDERRIYRQSGMVHLFAISGLHVGVLFSLLMGVLVVCRIPFSARHFLAPALVLGYVAITGFAPSAVRAWLMLTIWSAGRGWKRESMPVNAVLLAAAVLLLRPFNLFQAGFQYSFTIVLCLLLGWGQTMRLVGWIIERQLWRAGRRPPWRYHLDRGATRVLAACCAMTAAWLGGVGLSAMHTQLFLPFGAAINLLAGLMVWPIFALAALKLAVATLGLDSMAAGLGHLLIWPINGIRELAALGSDYGAVRAIPRPPLLLVLAYYLALAAFLGARGPVRHLRWPAVATGLLLLAIGVGVMSAPPRPAITVLMPAGTIVPVIAIEPPMGREPVLINSGDDYFGFTLRAWLQVRGHRDIDTLILLDNTVIHYGGAPELLVDHPARSVFIVPDTRRGMDELEAATAQAGGRLRILEADGQPLRHGPWQIEKAEHDDGGDYAVEFRWDPEPAVYRLEIHYHELTGTTLRLYRDGQPLGDPRHYPYRSDLHEDILLDRW